jgi:predicted RNase H-like HicB family nuclease
VAAAPSIDFTIAFDEPDEDGWIVARVLEVPGALGQGRTRAEAREIVLDALRTVLTLDDELSGRRTRKDLEHLRLSPRREASRSGMSSTRAWLP